MSLKPSSIQPVPEETARIARAAFRKGSPLLHLRDELGTIFSDADFAGLFPQLGQPGLPPWRLALIAILQFCENLANRQAVKAVRARIDWKYLLGLELADPGFDHSVLCEFPPAWARAVRWSACCTSCSNAAGNLACSRHAASSAPMQPMC